MTPEQFEYELYVDECYDNQTMPISFIEWMGYFEAGELFLLD